MKRLALLFLILSCAASTARESRIIGAGTLSCGQWTHRHESQVYLGSMEGWLVGFISGVNSMSPHEILSGRDYDGLTAWMDNYCQAHPLDPLVKGAHDLAIELVRKAQEER